mmetsp:Transcript_12178/g.28921  ORF Transcript_12178/g.28921 Transcript_12178/m.28921 type:complete len:246 (-) Transcript_12178:256-993(-)
MSSSSWAKCEHSKSKTSWRVSKFGSLSARLKESAQIWCSASMASTPTESGASVTWIGVGEPLSLPRDEDDEEESSVTEAVVLSVFCFLQSLSLGDAEDEDVTVSCLMRFAVGASIAACLSLSISISRSARMDSTWRKASCPYCRYAEVLRLTKFPFASLTTKPEHPSCPNPTGKYGREGIKPFTTMGFPSSLRPTGLSPNPKFSWNRRAHSSDSTQTSRNWTSGMTEAHCLICAAQGRHPPHPSL